jgi:hypothetical protein
MRFTPKTKEELQTLNLIPPGEYNFEVIEAYDKDKYGGPLKSQSGNEKISLKLKIWDANGKERLIFDNLLTLESWAYKLYNFCATTGILSKYESGSIEAKDCIGRTGKVRIVIEKDKTGDYKDKNSVKDYVVNGNGSGKKLLELEDDSLNSDIPF